MAKQTRLEHYEECKSQNLPLPEIVKAGQVSHTVGSDKILVKDADVNETDWREIDEKGNPGPWQKADAQS